MAKDTAETAPQLETGAAELAALEAARKEYQALKNAYQSDPSNQTLGGTSNEEYTALKNANAAKLAAESAYYKALKGTADDPFRFNPRFNDELAYQTDSNGNFGLGLRPEGGLYYNDYSGSMIGTPPPPASGLGSALPGGGGGVGGPDEALPVDPNQEYQDPFSPPPNYDPQGGNGLPNGGIPLGYKGWTGQQPRQGVDYGGVGVGGTTPTAPVGDQNPGLIGYESSSNKDFYQKQFQDMRTQQNDQRAAEMAASIRAQEAAQADKGQAFGGDPWSWTNLPDVKVGTGQAEVSPVSWELNSSYGITPDMTNRQAVGALGQLLTPQEAAMMAKNFTDAPDSASSSNWLTSNPQQLLGAMGSNSTLSPEFANTLQKVFNNIYTKKGGNTGISTPEGYALPVNVGE